LAVALGAVFRTTIAGRCAARPDLAGTALPLLIRIPALPSRSGPDLVRRFFQRFLPRRSPGTRTTSRPPRTRRPADRRGTGLHPADRQNHRADRLAEVGAERLGLVARTDRCRRRGDGGQATGQSDSRRKGARAARYQGARPGNLRIIYGPDYTEPANLERLRERNLGHKQSLALRENALGFESLPAGPGSRCGGCTKRIAVLAMEAEPVDPRL
jgi:hypothetical protein